MWDVHASFLPGVYLDGVTLAGGIAALLPPQPVDADIAARVLDTVDGLIITGGKDVDPGVRRRRVGGGNRGARRTCLLSGR